MPQDIGRISGPLLAENLLRKTLVGTGGDSPNDNNIAFETDLLFLDIENARIGIHTEGIASGIDLRVVGTTRTTNLKVDTEADIADLRFYSNKIQNDISGDIQIVPNQSTNPVVRLKELQNANLSFTNQKIENLISNSNIEITPNGAGRVEFYTSKVNVNGWLHSTGNITWDGNIIFGSDNTDNVDFSSDINSSIIPNTTDEFDLGSSSQRWQTLFTKNLVTDTLTLPSAISNNIDLLLRQGNTIYVSTTGNDDYTSGSTSFVGVYDNATLYAVGDIVSYLGNYYRRISDPLVIGYLPTDLSRWVLTEVIANDGQHPHSPFRTIKKALSVAQNGDEIVIFPGTYIEEFPLTVPTGVSVRGSGIRAVNIQPTIGTNHQDAFLMYGETTISFLTVQNFFYDSINDVGYAFRLGQNAKVTTRSPYVFNVTVLTKGSVTSVSDPLGFNQGDAGRGALIDGSVVHPDSKEATGLFFSATFITPNAVGIWGKNGARIEWLNSFTYYAEKGIYLTTGSEGFASLGARFGAEMRSINSANVYGTYGAVADGADTLGYLIGHNFGYIGCGADSNNDQGLVLQANEVVAINTGVIYYDSMDHKGDYRVGDIFYINQETGQVSFDAQSINLSAQGNITLEGPNGVTIIDATQVRTGNIRIHDNNIDSLTGPVNFLAASGSTYLNTDVFVTGNTTISADVNVKGTVYLGDTPYDTITVYPKLDQNINPKTDRTYNLGHKLPVAKVWDTAFITTLDIDAVTQATNNTISTLTTDTDLELIAAGTGIVHVTGTDVQIDEDLTVDNILTVNGLTTLQDTEIVGTVTQTGDFNQIGLSDYYIEGTFQTVNLEVLDPLSYLDVPNIKIVTNEIQATATNSDLIFTATGTGGVRLDDKIKITDNNFSNQWSGAATDLQKSIVLAPNGTGNVVINSNKSITIPYANNTDRVLSQAGEIRQNSTTKYYEGYLSNIANASFYNLFDADRNTYITPELTPGANDNTLRFANNGVVYTTITDYALTNNVVHIDDIEITNNIIRNLISSNDINVGVDPTTINNLNDILIQENTITNQLDSAITLASTTTGYFKFAGSNAIRIPTGTTADRRDLPETGEIRINSDNDHEMEVFNGITWLPASGPLSAASEEEVIDIMDTMALIFG